MARPPEVATTALARRKLVVKHGCSDQNFLHFVSAGKSFVNNSKPPWLVLVKCPCGQDECYLEVKGWTNVRYLHAARPVNIRTSTALVSGSHWFMSSCAGCECPEGRQPCMLPRGQATCGPEAGRRQVGDCWPSQPSSGSGRAGASSE